MVLLSPFSIGETNLLRNIESPERAQAPLSFCGGKRASDPGLVSVLSKPLLIRRHFTLVRCKMCIILFPLPLHPQFWDRSGQLPLTVSLSEEREQWGQKALKCLAV